MYASSTFQVSTLSGSLPILTCQAPHLLTTNLFLWVRRGNLHDPAGQQGVTHLLEHLLLRGEFPGIGNLAERIEERGGQLDGAVYRDFMRVNLVLDQEDLPLGLRSLAAILRRGPDMSYFESERQAIAEEASELADIPEIFLRAAAADLLPPAAYLGGSADGVLALTPEAVLDYWQSVTAGELLLLVVSSRPHAEVRDLAEEAFRGAQPPGGLADPPRLVVERARPELPVAILPREEQGRSYLTLAFQLPDLDFADYFAMHTCDSLLCQGVASRLFRVLRDAGLIYDLSSEFDFGTYGHRFTITTSTGSENVERVMRTLMAELRAVAAGNLSDAERQRAAQLNRGRHLLFFESPSNLGKFLGLAYMTYGQLPPADLIHRLTGPENMVRAERLLAHMAAPGQRAAALWTDLEEPDLANKVAAWIA